MARRGEGQALAQGDALPGSPGGEAVAPRGKLEIHLHRGSSRADPAADQVREAGIVEGEFKGDVVGLAARTSTRWAPQARFALHRLICTGLSWAQSARQPPLTDGRANMGEHGPASGPLRCSRFLPMPGDRRGRAPSREEPINVWPLRGE